MVSELRRSLEFAELTQASITQRMATEASTQGFSPQTFSSLISFKLDKENFLAWQQQVEATIKDYKLQSYLDKDQIPKKFSFDVDEE